MEFSGIGKEDGSARLDREEVEERRTGVREGSVGVHWGVGKDDLVRSGDCVNTHSYGEKREEERGKEHDGGGNPVLSCSYRAPRVNGIPGPETLLLVLALSRFALALVVTIVIDVRYCLRSRMARRHRQPMQLFTG